MTSLALAAPAQPLVDVAARSISGLAVPYGPAGQTSAGRLQFAAGSLSWASAGRVKLLREHDQHDPIGVGRELVELTAAEVDARMVAAGRDPIGLPGLWATFHVPEGDNGDRALAEAASGLRDAFSVGVQLDDKSAERLRRANGAAVAASGALREVSQVSVPAFDDARVGSVAAHADLTVSSWSDASPASSTPTPTGDSPVTEPTPTPAPEPTPTPAPTPAPTNPEQPSTPVTPAAAPVAAAGAALVTGEPATYTFAGVDGPSFVADAYAARMHGDGEAAGRLARLNAELAAGNPASVMALAAVMTTDDAGAVPLVAPNVRRPDLLLSAVDNGRPILSRINKLPIRNATPFLIPTEGEFDGVDLHTEGTAHVPEGTYDLGETTVTPRAMSGAFRVSREMVDSSNPAIDRLALAAMLRDYRRKTEARVVAALAVEDAAATLNVNTVAELRGAVLGFGDDTVTPDVVVAGRGFLTAILGDTDTTGRPMLPYIGAQNASGTTRAGYTGFSLDGLEVVRATSLPAAEAYILDLDSIMVAESAAQTFRFDEVEGPGIIKLALFGYFAVGVLRAGAVVRLTTAAA